MNERMNSLKQNTARLSVAAVSLMLLFKLLAGLATGAISMLSEAVHSAADLLATLFAFYAVRKSAASPDAKHRYGYGKLENISGSLEALFMIAAALWVLYEAYEKYHRAHPPVLLAYGIISMTVSMIVNCLVSHKMLAAARRTSSPALKANALHLRADMWTSGGVLAGLLLLQITGWAWLDSLIAVIVAVVILKTGGATIQKNIAALTDISLPNEEKQQISHIVRQHAQVISLCKLRTRYSGSQRSIDMRLRLDKHMPLNKAHAVCDQIEAAISRRFGIDDIMIQLEPGEEKTPAAVLRSETKTTFRHPAIEALFFSQNTAPGPLRDV